MKERLIIIFVAIIAGLFITSAGFFIYQTTKSQKDTKTVAAKQTVTPVEEKKDEGSIYVKVSEPMDEVVMSKRTVVVKGSTNPENIIIISSNIEDVEVKPSQQGDFSATIDIDSGVNPITTRALAPDGTQAVDIRTVAYTTEDF